MVRTMYPLKNDIIQLRGQLQPETLARATSLLAAIFLEHENGNHE